MVNSRNFVLFGEFDKMLLELYSEEALLPFFHYPGCSAGICYGRMFNTSKFGSRTQKRRCSVLSLTNE